MEETEREDLLHRLQHAAPSLQESIVPREETQGTNGTELDETADASPMDVELIKFLGWGRCDNPPCHTNRRARLRHYHSQKRGCAREGKGKMEGR